MNIDALRAALDAANQDRALAAATQQWEELFDPDTGEYRYGHERTYGQLAEAIVRVREEIEAELEAIDHPVFIIGPNEDMAAATARIDNVLDARWPTDPRIVLLMNTWGWHAAQESMLRMMRFHERHRDVLDKHGVAVFTSPTITSKLRMDYGLEDLLPGVSD